MEERASLHSPFIRGSQMPRKTRPLAILSGGILLFGSQAAVAGGPFSRHACAPNRGGVCKTPYGEYESLDLVSQTSIMLVAPPEETPLAADADHVPLTRFSGDVTTIATNGLLLDRIGANLASDGRAEITGRLAFDGGPHDAIEGAHAVIRVRAFAGTPQQAGELFRTALLFETSRRVWVGKNELRMVSLVPPPPYVHWQDANSHIHVHSSRPEGPASLRTVKFAELVSSQYSRITHVEVVLELRAAK